MFVLVLVVIVGLIIAMMCINKNRNTEQKDSDNSSLTSEESSNNELTLEVGFSREDVVNEIKNKFNVGDNLLIDYKGIDEENEGQQLTSVKLYYNSEGKEVSFDEAVEVGIGLETLKEGYTCKEYYVGIGKYKVNITDFDSNKKYEMIIDIKDSVAPVLEVKDVTVNEGDIITINSFIVSCNDNSYQSCEINYINDNNEILDTIDMSVGERVIKIVAMDKSKNRSEVKEAKLVVNSGNSSTKENTSQTTGNSSNSSSSSKSNSSSSGKESSSNSGVVNSSHPFVKAAKSMVGKTNVADTDVVEQALKTVNKTLWVKNIGDVKILLDINNGKSDYVGSGEAVCNKTYKDTVIDLGEFDYKRENNHEVSQSRKIYVKNQFIYKVVVTTCTDGKCVDAEENNTYLLGKQYYYCDDKSYIKPANIKLIAKEVPLSSIQPGDFLFYNDGGKGSNHIAVYIGNNQAVHGGWESKREVVIKGVKIGGKASTPTAWRVSY